MAEFYFSHFSYNVAFLLSFSKLEQMNVIVAMAFGVDYLMSCGFFLREMLY